MRVVLCCGTSGCPAVEFKDDGVEIGETGNRVKLKSDEWNLLVDKVKSGELGKV